MCAEKLISTFSCEQHICTPSGGLIRKEPVQAREGIEAGPGRMPQRIASRTSRSTENLHLTAEAKMGDLSANQGASRKPAVIHEVNVESDEPPSIASAELICGNEHRQRVQSTRYGNCEHVLVGSTFDDRRLEGVKEMGQAGIG